VSATHTVGIDLGTTHSALVRVALEGDRAEAEVLPIPQLVARGSIGNQPLLPSFLYVAHASEGPQPLPWDAERSYAVGEYARSRGVEAPGRLVSSAKSWLGHSGVDRKSGLLPLGAPEDVATISPVEASRRYLEHLGEAYRAAHERPLCEEEIVLTVPASFDAAARDLTVEAATTAGLTNLTLLEEPQAALYAWIDAKGDAWRKELRVGDVLLVVDIGGGTSDFSAILATERDGSLELERVAVGEHILLGGDNMDLALAHVVAQKITATGKEIDRSQMAALTHACRAAKERLFADSSVTSVPVAIAGRGSSLFGSTLRSEVTRQDVSTILVEGFFPSVAASARPVARARAALTRMGLPYAQDAAITRHLAAFLGKQARAIDGTSTRTLLHPTAVLFNGGVMKAVELRSAVMNTLNGWLDADGGAPARELDSADLDLAVARGAAYYGRARRGRGLRIRGGTARAHYVGIESAAPAVPGVEPPITALCVAPFGMEEGSRAELPAHELAVVVGEPVHFRFFASTTRRSDRAGDEVERWREGELEELAPIAITLESEGRAPGDFVPIRLEASITEVGTLLIEALPLEPIEGKNERWRVELGVRGD